jgi:hypothetical protein
MMPRMDVDKELTYAAAPGEVFAMLSDEAFRKQVAEATHARSFDVSITAADGRTKVRISRVMEAPDIAKRVVGDAMEVIQVEDWGQPDEDGSRRAEWSLEIPGKPGSVRGSMSLRPVAKGSVQAIRGEVSVKIPLVGGKLEKEIARALESGIRTEGEIGSRWLAR